MGLIGSPSRCLLSLTFLGFPLPSTSPSGNSTPWSLRSSLGRIFWRAATSSFIRITLRSFPSGLAVLPSRPSCVSFAPCSFASHASALLSSFTTSPALLILMLIFYLVCRFVVFWHSILPRIPTRRLALRTSGFSSGDHASLSSSVSGSFFTCHLSFRLARIFTFLLTSPFTDSAALRIFCPSLLFVARRAPRYSRFDSRLSFRCILLLSSFRALLLSRSLSAYTVSPSWYSPFSGLFSYFSLSRSDHSGSSSVSPLVHIFSVLRPGLAHALVGRHGGLLWSSSCF